MTTETTRGGEGHAEILEGEGVARATFELTEPQTRLRVRTPRKLGRAEARFGKANWAAKHHWAEGDEEERVTTYEFDEAIPAGKVELVAPLE